MLAALATAVTGGGFAMTLMACYGLPPCKDKVDEDHDGFFTCKDGGSLDAPDDCNDHDPTVHPGAPDELGDGIDQNCDAVDGIVTETSTGTGTSSSASTGGGGAGGGGGATVSSGSSGSTSSGTASSSLASSGAGG